MTKALFFLFALRSVAAPDPVRIPDPYRDCSKTAECETVPLRCGCCQFGSVSKYYATEYLDFAAKQNCTDEPCHCQPQKLKPVCVNKVCQLVDPDAPKPVKSKKVAKPGRSAKKRPKRHAKKPAKKKKKKIDPEAAAAH